MRIILIGRRGKCEWQSKSKGGAGDGYVPCTSHVKTHMKKKYVKIKVDLGKYNAS